MSSTYEYTIKRAWACVYCPDRRIFAHESDLKEHAKVEHKDRLPAHDEELEAFLAAFAIKSVQESVSYSDQYFDPILPPVRKDGLDLPLIVDGRAMTAIPDSRTEDNIIAQDLVTQLGLDVDDEPENQKEFRIANSSVTKAIGRVKVSFRFAHDQGEEHQTWFYVFRSFFRPLLFGMEFLDATETLTKHRYRLESRSTSFSGPLRVAALNNPKRRLYCWPKYSPSPLKYPRRAALKIMMANADTGSEVDLISLDLCRRERSISSTRC